MRTIVLPSSKVPIELPPFSYTMRHGHAIVDPSRTRCDIWVDIRFLFPMSTGVSIDRSRYALRNKHRNYWGKLRLYVFFKPNRRRLGNAHGMELRYTRVAEGFRQTKEVM
jgi:hypothetical protein